jgi:hypothetical protein
VNSRSLMRTELKATMVVVVLLAFASGVSRAAEVLDPAQLDASYALGSNTVGVLWVQVYDAESNTEFHGSGFVIGKRKDAGGNFLKTYIAVPMHDTAGLNVTLAGTGNFEAQDGWLLTNLQVEYESPFWNPDAPNSTAGDVAIYSSTTAVPDSWVHVLAPLNAIPYPGYGGDISGVATSAGYGYPSTTNEFLSNSGDAMGYRGNLVTFLPDEVEANDHYLGMTMDPADNLFLAGAANPGDSGSMVLNTNGQIIGMIVSSTGGATDTWRESIFDNFTSAAYREQVAPYAGIIVPQPTLNFEVKSNKLVLSWTGTFTLQSATNVAGPYLDVVGAISPRTNLMTAGREFFRLRN